MTHLGSRLPPDISFRQPRSLPDVEVDGYNSASDPGIAMQRRAFISLIGSVAAWPLAARAQQRSMASIGILGLGTLEQARRNFVAVRSSLVELGYVEGQNLSVQFRCADFHSERLPALATELTQIPVGAIIAPSGPSVSAAMAATQSIPIIFFTGFDPVESGFVAYCFFNNRNQLIALMARHGLPAIYGIREYPEAGALCSYGTNYSEAFRQVGVYTGRVLKGEKPTDLPVQQVTKIELVINLRTAKSLGITVPQTLLARADEVIE